jgi:hypothetical protein
LPALFKPPPPEELPPFIELPLLTDPDVLLLLEAPGPAPLARFPAEFSPPPTCPPTLPLDVDLLAEAPGPAPVARLPAELRPPPGDVPVPELELLPDGEPVVPRPDDSDGESWPPLPEYPPPPAADELLLRMLPTMDQVPCLTMRPSSGS